MAVSDIIRIAEAQRDQAFVVVDEAYISTPRLTPCFRCLLTIPIW